ncbi:MAG: hypothetical protein WBX15_04805 [Thermoanaerobaculia bacterium]
MPNDQIARVVLGMAVTIALAVLAAHPKVRQFERRLGLTVLVASGLPFLILGAVFRLESVGILTDRVLHDLKPAFDFGLGWVGFVVGAQLDIRRLERLPSRLGPVIALLAFTPTLLTVIACSLILLSLGVFPGDGLVRDTIVLAACAAASAPGNLKLLLRHARPAAVQLVIEITRIDQVAALGIFAFVAITFRPAAGIATWVLPRSAWLLVTLGVGTLLGALTYILIWRVRDEIERTTILIGGVALAAGTAGYLAVSVPVVCAIAGALMMNLPLPDAEPMRKTLATVERPLYLLFLFILGASWQPGQWEGWVLALGFVLARNYGKLVASRWAVRVGPEGLPSAPAMAVALMPESPIAIVVIFSAATLYSGYPSSDVLWVIHAVIIGSILTDVTVQIVQRRQAARIGIDETYPGAKRNEETHPRPPRARRGGGEKEPKSKGVET